jgi:putative CocE/NonD family hydrolase|nr:CocE/NonD family hydrolase [Candidatus Krumholzibacteria bacterium]
MMRISMIILVLVGLGAVTCLAEEAPRANPDSPATSPKVRYGQALRSLEAGDLDGAENALRALLLEAPDNPHCLRQLAGIEMARNYDRREFMVPMRDGVRLFTEVYLPKDQSREYPILLNRTPYSALFRADMVLDHFSFPGPGARFPKEGYIFVIQDVRGRYRSEGTFEVLRPHVPDPDDERSTNESTDAHDTISWLLDNLPGHNGRVGVHGMSWPGYYAAMALVDAHPAIRAAVIEAPVSGGFRGDDYHHNGALHYLYSFRWLNNVGLRDQAAPTTDIQPPIFREDFGNYFHYLKNLGPLVNLNKQGFRGQVAFWNDITRHPDEDDFWRRRELAPLLTGLKDVAVLVAGSWFDDQDLYGTLQVYRALENGSPHADTHLVMGVWNHASWWDQKTAPWGVVGLPVKETGSHYRDKILTPFFASHLKGDGQFPLAEATVFESGTRAWREYAVWPPSAVTSRIMYLEGGEGLRWDAPPAEKGSWRAFVSDPADPVPHQPVDTIFGWNAGYMHADQRYLEGRDDVISFLGPSLTEECTLAGPVVVDLSVATTGEDADWVVKLIDVFPAGEGDSPEVQMLVRGDIMRGRYRDSFSAPTPLTSGEVDRVRFTLPDVNHTFAKGHRIMVQIHSSWFPVFDINPQTWVNIYQAGAEDFRAAEHRVYHGQDHPSCLVLPVLTH